jgi:hypothetical protein
MSGFVSSIVSKLLVAWKLTSLSIPGTSALRCAHANGNSLGDFRSYLLVDADVAKSVFKRLQNRT